VNIIAVNTVIVLVVVLRMTCTFLTFLAKETTPLRTVLYVFSFFTWFLFNAYVCAWRRHFTVGIHSNIVIIIIIVIVIIHAL
jgi:hypothetical protein